MTHEGKFSWDLDINDMKVEELDALMSACTRARSGAMLREFDEKLIQFLREIDSAGYHLEVPVAGGDARWMPVDASNIFIKEKPTAPIEV